jgi:carbon-monoxide dehydrogenase small subunit
MIALAVAGSEITTVEGLAHDSDRLSRIQTAFVEQGGVQCGFCTPGFLITLTALLGEQPAPTEEEIRTALAGNICRCTGYSQIVEAALEAASEDAAS